jgi:hypothetical protein
VVTRAGLTDTLNTGPLVLRSAPTKLARLCPCFHKQQPPTDTGSSAKRELNLSSLHVQSKMGFKAIPLTGRGGPYVCFL